MFQKKSKNVQEQITAIDQRLAELEKRKIAKEKDVQEVKDSIGQILGLLALSENSENAERLKNGKKALGRTEEAYTDICQQLDFLKTERSKLGIELLQAKVRDLPLTMEEKTTAFNLALEEGLVVMETLRDVYDKMKASEISFTALSKEYFDACEKLQVVRPLELKTGFGILAFEPYPFGMSFQLPNFTFLLGSLEAYKLKLESVADFKRTNPDYEKHLAETREHDRKSGELEFSRDGFLKTFSLPGS